MNETLKTHEQAVGVDAIVSKITKKIPTEMTYHEKLIWYATAPRLSIGTIGKIEGGNFVNYFVGKLRGMIVSMDDGSYKFTKKDDARYCALSFREKCKKDALSIGLI